MTKQFTSSQLAAMLDDALNKFQSVKLADPQPAELTQYNDEDRWIAYLKPEYALFPDKDRALLGKGGYGSAYKVKSAKNKDEPIRVVKVVVKHRVCSNALQIQHMCAELAVTGLISHPQLNHRTALYHNSTHMFIILELCGGPRPDPLTRVAHIVANRRPQRIPEIEGIHSQWSDMAKAQGVDVSDDDAFNEYIDKSGLVARLAVECGASLSREKPELPVATDLFGLIVANKKLTDPVAQIITRQILLGLEHLHQCQIVHRDMKTENVVIGVHRKVNLHKDKDGKIESASFNERYDVKVIDFGLVKYLNVKDGVFGDTSTPGSYIRASQEGQKQNDAPEEEDAFANVDLGSLDIGGGAGANKKPDAPAFNVAVTPACTEIYAPFEVIHGILQNGVGRHKWSSPKAGLPKVDVYGTGTILFCMSNGRPPFRPAGGGPISREEKMRQIERQILVGPTFSSATSQQSKEMTLKMMIHDAAMRPNASEALMLPFVHSVGDTVVTTFKTDGTKEAGLLRDVKASVPSQAIVDDDPSSPVIEHDQEADHDIESAILAAARNREDDGDAAGKEKLTA